MVAVQKINFVNLVQLVVIKNLNKIFSQEVQVHFVGIITYIQHKRPLRVQEVDFFVHGQIPEIFFTHGLIFLDAALEQKNNGDNPNLFLCQATLRFTNAAPLFTAK